MASDIQCRLKKALSPLYVANLLFHKGSKILPEKYDVVMKEVEALHNCRFIDELLQATLAKWSNEPSLEHFHEYFV